MYLNKQSSRLVPKPIRAAFTELLTNDDFSNALKLAKNLLLRGNPVHGASIWFIHELNSLKRYKDSLLLCRIELNANPDCPCTQHVMADLLFDLGRFAKAERSYLALTEALSKNTYSCGCKLDPFDQDYFLGDSAVTLAEIYEYRSCYDKAVEQLMFAVKLTKKGSYVGTEKTKLLSKLEAAKALAERSQTPRKEYLSADYTFLRWHAARGVGNVHYLGYDWLKDKFLPALKRLERRAATFQEHEVLADAYYLLGDIHDFNDAPKQAINAYKASISHFPYSTYASGAWRELGIMHERIGQYNSAVKALKRATKINPDDERAVSDLECALDEQRYNYPPLYDFADHSYKALDLLARGQPKAALQTLERSKGILTRRLRACCFGQLMNMKSYFLEWEAITKLKGMVSLDYYDWFYMPVQISDSAVFWKYQLSISRQNRFSPGVYEVSNGLDHHIKRPNTRNGSSKESIQQIIKNRLKNKEYIKWVNRTTEQHCLYRIAVDEDDLDTLIKMRRTYPKWVDIPDGIRLVERTLSKQQASNPKTS